MLRVVKRGQIYQIEGYLSRKRVRATLGIRDRQAALLASAKIERALAQGKSSDLWPELAQALPPRSFQQLAALVCYQEKPQAPAHTWQTLRRAFIAHCRQRIARRKLRQSTLDRYIHTLNAFTAFLAERGITKLEEITRPTVEAFKAWRLEKIMARTHSRGGGGLDLDIAVLHRVFSYALEGEMVSRNPVKMEGKPGARPERGAQPFKSEELAKLREHADEDRLMFLLLRHTGLRGGDAVAVSWAEIDLRRKVLRRRTQKRGKPVVIPLHTELLFALQTEHATRNPKPEDPVLLNPSTGRPMARPRLYYRMKALGNRAGVPNVHPHRFRDTLSVDMLLRGSSAYDVAKLLGDTVSTVEVHYSEYVQELQERVRRILESPGGLEDLATLQPQSPSPKRTVH